MFRLPFMIDYNRSYSIWSCR